MKKTFILLVTLMTVCFANAQIITFDWANNYPNSWFDEGRCLDVDKNGNVYVAGNLYGTTDFDPSPAVYNLTSLGANDVFVAKYDSLGAFIWAKQIGNSSVNYSYSMNVDPQGNVYTTGVFGGILDFDPSAASYTIAAGSPRAMFICKLDFNGNFLWAKHINNGWIPSLTIDNNKNVIITDAYNNMLDLDPGIGVFAIGTSTINPGTYILKLDSLGDFIWAKHSIDVISASYTGQFQYCVKTDLLGNIYTTGYFSGIVDFNPSLLTYSLTSLGNNDGFISKFDASGNFIWAKQIGSSNNEAGTAITIDPLGNVFTTGYFKGTVDFDPSSMSSYTLSSLGLSDVFVSKLNPLGDFVWAKQIGGTGYGFSQSIVLDVYNNVYTTGYYSGIADFDPTSGYFNLTSAGNKDVFISKLDLNGGFMWAKSMGGSNNDNGCSISLFGNNTIYTAGNTEGIADFDPDSGVYNLTNDTIVGGFFIQKLNQDKPVGITKFEKTEALTIFPNPTRDLVFIISNNEINEVEISDISGTILFSEKIINKKTKLQFSSFDTGIYFVKISQSNGMIFTKKIILYD